MIPLFSMVLTHIYLSLNHKWICFEIYKIALYLMSASVTWFFLSSLCSLGLSICIFLFVSLIFITEKYSIMWMYFSYSSVLFSVFGKVVSRFFGVCFVVLFCLFLRVFNIINRAAMNIFVSVFQGSCATISPIIYLKIELLIGRY